MYTHTLTLWQRKNKTHLEPQQALRNSALTPAALPVSLL